MPSRNALKTDTDETFYHIYARGNNKQAIFQDQTDYYVFFNLLKRYLSDKPAKDPWGVIYPHLYGELELLCYCLIPNHFHLLVYQNEAGAMSRLMRGLMTSYSCYFNKKYKRTGALFEGRYKAATITNDQYLEHITRYIHLNPAKWRGYEFSSLSFYLRGGEPSWLKPKRITELFNGSEEYLAFLEDYLESKRMLDELKHELADS